ncbi:MAG: hypothetical protein U9R34_07895 [Nanoarchaeota archaeon]|nr:hypothetical protein [Nanoarchaeota archaeon]
MKTQKNKIKELDERLDDLKKFKPVGLPRVVIAEGDWRKCNPIVYEKYLEKVEQVRPEGADGFLQGEWINSGRYRDEFISYVPIQFYRKKSEYE